MSTSSTGNQHLTPNQTLYVHNLNEKIKKDGNRSAKGKDDNVTCRTKTVSLWSLWTVWTDPRHSRPEKRQDARPSFYCFQGASRRRGRHAFPSGISLFRQILGNGLESLPYFIRRRLNLPRLSVRPLRNSKRLSWSRPGGNRQVLLIVSDHNFMFSSCRIDPANASLICLFVFIYNRGLSCLTWSCSLLNRVPIHLSPPLSYL